MKLLMELAILPGLLLAGFVYHIDRLDKEPKPLLVKLFILGMVITIPCAFIEVFAQSFVYNFVYGDWMRLIIENFLAIALIEEGCKYLILKTTWKKDAFDYKFDAVVYAVCVSMGFAVLENILYVLDGGIVTALARAVTSIPGHAIFALYMGHYYGMAKERAFDKVACKKNKVKALWVPIFIHGLYDLLATINSSASFIIFIVFVIVLEIVAFKNVKRFAIEDRKIW